MKTITAPDDHPEQGLWLAPMKHCVLGDDDQDPYKPSPIALDDYLQLVDATGRIVRGDKRGAIPAHLAPILERLDLDIQSWIGLMQSHGKFIGTAIGHYAARAAEAARRGLRWIKNTLPDVFSQKPQANTT